MHIINATLADDSERGALGRYECRAFAVNDSQEKKHGFIVNVISSKYYQYIQSNYSFSLISLLSERACTRNSPTLAIFKSNLLSELQNKMVFRSKIQWRHDCLLILSLYF